MKKLYRVGLESAIIEAENEEQARIGFANYIGGDCGIENFTVSIISKAEIKNNELEPDWTA